MRDLVSAAVAVALACGIAWALLRAADAEARLAEVEADVLMALEAANEAEWRANEIGGRRTVACRCDWRLAYADDTARLRDVVAVRCRDGCSASWSYDHEAPGGLDGL